MADQVVTTAVAGALTGFVVACQEIYRRLRGVDGMVVRRDVGRWVPDPGYNYETGTGSMAMRYEEISDSGNLRFAVMRALDATGIVAQTAQAVESVTKHEAGRVGYLLSQLSVRAGEIAARRGVEQAAHRTAGVLLRDLGNEPIPVALSLHLRGCIVRQPMAVTGTVRIGPPGPEDVARAGFGLDGVDMSRCPQAVLTVRTVSSLQPPPSGQEWVTALRLATRAPIRVVRTITAPLAEVAVFPFGVVSMLKGPTHEGGFVLEPRDAKLARAVQRAWVAGNGAPHAQAAIERLDRSIWEPTQQAQGLLYALWALESLLMVGDEAARLTVSTRAALLHGLLGGDAEHTREIVKTAYTCRHKYAHDRPFDSRQADALTQAHRATRDLACRFIVTSLATGLAKEELIRRIDRAMVSIVEAQRLRSDLRVAFRRAGLGGALGTWKGAPLRTKY